MSTINLQGGNTMLSTGMYPPARVASTGSPLNPATGGLLTVDGVALAVGDRVLCKDETSAVNNGIYAAQTGPWVRTADASTNAQFFSGMAVTVGLGTVNAGQTFICTCTDDPVVVGTSLITWASQQAVATGQQAATSTTSLTIGTGSQTLTVQSGKSFLTNNQVLIYETSNFANSMLGQVTSYSGGSLVVGVTNTSGSGTHTDWTVVLWPSNAAAGVPPPIGTGNVTGPGSSTAGHVATFADGTGKVLQDGGTLVGGGNTITPSMLADAAVGFALGMLNGTLVASVASSALTIAVKTLAGNDPSSSDPVYFLFRDASAGFAVIEQIAAISITVPSGATLGTVNGQASRIWVGVFNNGGTAVLGVYNSLNSSVPSVVSWDETATANGTGITAGSTVTQIWYTASLLTGGVFRVLGYVESTQTVAGTWAASPSKVQLFGPGAKKPGDVVQEVVAAVSSSANTSSHSFVALTGENIAISVKSAANVIRVDACGTVSATGAGGTNSLSLSRGTSANTNLFGDEVTVGPGTGFGAPLFGYDIPNTTGSVTYAVQGLSSGATVTFGPNTMLAAREIQI